MKTYEMTLILEEDPRERCYPEFSDGLIGVSCGVPYIDVGREAPSLEDAIQSALTSAKAVGVKVKQIRLEPNNFCS
jgi:hypothetical protein